MRLLGLDYGRKRIGLALTDPLGLTAQPMGFIEQSNRSLCEIAQKVSEYQVTEVIVGYPNSLNGTPGPMALEVERFAKALGERISCDIRFWDERFTSAEVENVLISADVTRKKRKESRDAMAAALLLQGYLESKRNS
jgi:putative Holliday junction resolvase